MITGVMVLGFDSEIPECRRVTEECVRRLAERGHSNVAGAFYRGHPSETEALDELTAMHADPIVVLPLVVSEGELSVHRLPKAMGMPDNCCSFTYDSEGHEAAVRFSTSFNWHIKVTELLEKRIMEAGGRSGDGILLIRHGSSMSYSAKDSAKHAERLREKGYTVEEASLSETGSIGKALSRLRAEVAGRIIAVPLTIVRTERSAQILAGASEGEEMTMAAPLGADGLMIEVMESKIPEGWRRTPGYAGKALCQIFVKHLAVALYGSDDCYDYLISYY